MSLNAPQRIPYKLADGSVVPSVTTIIDRFKNSRGLVIWAYNQGKSGLDMHATKQAAADAGTLAHLMVEAHIRGKAMPAAYAWPPEIWGKASNAFQNYLKWARQTSLRTIASEVRLVSEQYRFGGTLDAMLVDGDLSLGDWKSSNSVYQEYLLQLAGYGVLWEENHPDQPIVGGYHLIRFAKEEPDFAHYHYGDLATARRMFLLLREAYDCDLELKKRVK